MSAEAWANLMLFIVGLIGLIGVLASWPATVLWIVLLAVGWGVVLLINADSLT
ncbi:membrane protein [Streptomyces phage LuckySocke]|nr:membrane protein [Streptomyces phage LuckySocke]